MSNNLIDRWIAWGEKTRPEMDTREAKWLADRQTDASESKYYLERMERQKRLHTPLTPSEFRFNCVLIMLVIILVGAGLSVLVGV